MTFDQQQQSHEEIRERANALRKAAEHEEAEGNEHAAELFRYEARGMLRALETFWQIAK